MKLDKELEHEIFNMISMLGRHWLNVLKNPSAKMLKKYPILPKVMPYIYARTAKLNDPAFEYTLITRLAWIYNNYTDFGRCESCGNKITHWNFPNFKDQYKKTCCKQCERKIAQAQNIEHMLKTYGVTNAYQIPVSMRNSSPSFVSKTVDTAAYLTESLLGSYLEAIFNAKWIHDKAFITLKRPDYRNDELKLIVEFDGPQHYTSSSRIIADYERDKSYAEAGYKTVRIPYFIQLSKDVIKQCFGIESLIYGTYPHGFIGDAKTLVFPADFCELGVKRFLEDLKQFSCAKDGIITSLRDKIKKHTSPLCVLPPSLMFLIENSKA